MGSAEASGELLVALPLWNIRASPLPSSRRPTTSQNGRERSGSRMCTSVPFATGNFRLSAEPRGPKRATWIELDRETRRFGNAFGIRRARARMLSRNFPFEAKSVAWKDRTCLRNAGRVHELAWEPERRVVVYRVSDHIERREHRAAQIVPFVATAPGFVFSLSYAAGKALSQRLSRGETLRVRSPCVRAGLDSGPLSQHCPRHHPWYRAFGPDVWIQAHTNHRNTGGGGARGWGPLPFADAPKAHRRREARSAAGHSLRVGRRAHPIGFLARATPRPPPMLELSNLVMVGDHQILSESIRRLKHATLAAVFCQNVVQEMFEVVGRRTRSPGATRTAPTISEQLSPPQRRAFGQPRSLLLLHRGFLGAERSRRHRRSQSRRSRRAAQHVARPVYRDTAGHARASGRDPDETGSGDRRRIGLHSGERGRRRAARLGAKRRRQSARASRG